MRHLEDVVFAGNWYIIGRPGGYKKNFTLTIGRVEQGRFNGLVLDDYGAFPAEGCITSHFISFRKKEGMIGDRTAYARYQGILIETNGEYSITGTWQFSADSTIHGRFELKQQKQQKNL